MGGRVPPLWQSSKGRSTGLLLLPRWRMAGFISTICSGLGYQRRSMPLLKQFSPRKHIQQQLDPSVLIIKLPWFRIIYIIYVWDVLLSFLFHVPQFGFNTRMYNVLSFIVSQEPALCKAWSGNTMSCIIPLFAMSPVFCRSIILKHFNPLQCQTWYWHPSLRQQKIPRHVKKRLESLGNSVLS